MTYFHNAFQRLFINGGMKVGSELRARMQIKVICAARVFVGGPDEAARATQRLSSLGHRPLDRWLACLNDGALSR